MKILVTGSSGTVGSAFISHAEAHNHELLTPRRSDLNLLHYESVLTYLEQFRPQAIVHCAGLVGGIQKNIEEPHAFLNENLQMGFNLVNAAQEVKIFKLLNLSSSCVYPNDRDVPLKESDILTGPLEPTNQAYALAKLCVQQLCTYIRQAEPLLNYKTLIPCNIYGPVDDFSPTHSHLVPAAMRKVHHAVMTGRSVVEIWGDGTARREFMFSEDLADAMWFCLDRLHLLPDFSFRS